jgi:hypothetical protein
MSIFPLKEKLAMNLIVSTLVIVGLLFGGSATVAVAQNDLPTDVLYPVKLVSENAQLMFQNDPVEKIDMLMTQAQTRTEEMAALAAAGVTPPEALITRAQDRIQQALHLTATLNDADMTATLLQIRTRLQTQDQQMSKLQDGTCTECEPILLRTRDMLRTQLSQVENGLADPQAFRNGYRNQTRTTQTPMATNGLGTPQASCTPALDGSGQQNGNGNGYGNPSASGTPVPQGGGSGNGGGPGTGGNPTSMPGSGGGNGNPPAAGTPMPQGGGAGNPTVSPVPGQGGGQGGPGGRP